MTKVNRIIKKCVISCLTVLFKASFEDIANDSIVFSNQVMLYKKIIKFFPFIKFEFAFNKIIENVVEMKADPKMANQANLIFSQLFANGNDDVKITIVKLLYFTQLLTDENCKKIMDYALHTNNPDYRYWITQDISRITFRLQSGFYPDYYNDRNKLIEKIAKESGFDRASKKTNHKSNKICIICSMLDKSIANSTQRVVKMVTDGLADYFDEIQIVTLDVFSPSKSEKRKLCTSFPRKASVEYSKQIEALLNNKKIKIHYSMGKNYRERMQDALYTIDSYNPDVILDMSDEYSIISYQYSKDYYTVYLPLRGGASSLFYTKILSLKWKAEISNNRFKCIDLDRIEEWIFPEFVPKSDGEYLRKEYKLDDKDFILVTVGNNTGSCTDDFINAVVRILKEHENIKWILVGEKGPAYLHLNYKSYLDNCKIIEWGYESNLSALYKMCDVLVRPNMTGGSGATAIAAMNKIPISMTSYLCDPSRWLGVDFSKCDTYEQQLEDVMHMYHDKEYYLQRSEVSYNLVMKVVDEKIAWKSLALILKKDRGMI